MRMALKVIVRNLKKRYDAVEAARDVSFEIGEGEVFGLLGPNGAGKTTTVECIVGLREPDGGEIEVCGLDARRRPLEVKQKIGAALQTTALQDTITPREALALFGGFYRTSVPADQLLTRFGLADKGDVRFDTLSGGQRQRLALALAFVNNPELVFLDEPTAGLDPASRRELHGEIAQMKRDGHTVLLTTHYIEEAEQLCDRIAIIDRGRIVATGAPAELAARSSAMTLVSVTTAEPIDVAVLAGLPGVDDVVIDACRTRFRTAAPNTTVAALMTRLDERGLDLIELHARKASLEDIFIELTHAATRSGLNGTPGPASD